MAKTYRTEGIYQNVKAIKEFYDKEITKRKVEHSNIHALDAYGQLINSYLTKNSRISSKGIKEFIEANKKVNTQIF